MDQDAFRRLISTPKQNGSQQTSAGRGSLLPKANDDQKKLTGISKAAFKPRKIKKQSDADYRDRAAERRTGVAGDFAQVESVLENFEKQHANVEDKNAVEEQRRYLGGDAEHTVLVKGLDFALLEQAKARMTASTSAQDDEELEEAFRGAASASPPASEQATAGQKRTREDIIRELKNKRTKGDSNKVGASAPVVDRALEEAKREGKFKPIGFKPIGSSKDKEGKEVKKKKKRKIGEKGTTGGHQQPPEASVTLSSEQVIKKDDAITSRVLRDSDKKPPIPEPALEPEPVDEDFNIFADAGEYQGVNFDDDDDDNESSKCEDQHAEPRNEVNTTQVEVASSETRPRRKWIDDYDPPSPPPERPLPSLADRKAKETLAFSESDTPKERVGEAGEINDEQQPKGIGRLAPLASSALPSIRDILEADSALEAEKKRKARKEKRKRGGGGDGDGEGNKVSVETKLNRDYQKLKSYTEKKGRS